jgi:UDP-glucose 6-dehydrogenase
VQPEFFREKVQLVRQHFHPEKVVFGAFYSEKAAFCSKGAKKRFCRKMHGQVQLANEKWLHLLCVVA